MNILAIDTAMTACSAAVFATDRGLLAARFERLARGHAERLMPMIGEVMEEAGLDFPALERLAVTVGPGNFTGLRIGLAAARGLALAADIPLVGASTLRVIAAGADEDERERPVAVAHDAKRDQVYFSVYDAAGRELTAPVALTHSEAAAALPAGPVRLAGSGARLVAGAMAVGLDRIEILAGFDAPDAAVLARLAPGLQVSGRPVAPLYLRAPDAVVKPPLLAFRP